MWSIDGRCGFFNKRVWVRFARFEVLERFHCGGLAVRVNRSPCHGLELGDRLRWWGRLMRVRCINMRRAWRACWRSRGGVPGVCSMGRWGGMTDWCGMLYRMSRAIEDVLYSAVDSMQDRGRGIKRRVTRMRSLQCFARWFAQRRQEYKPCVHAVQFPTSCLRKSQSVNKIDSQSKSDKTCIPK